METNFWQTRSVDIEKAISIIDSKINQIIQCNQSFYHLFIVIVPIDNFRSQGKRLLRLIWMVFAFFGK